VSDLPSGLSGQVADPEEVARAIMSSSWFAPTTGRIKHNTYLPAPDDDTSVFRTIGLDRGGVQTLLAEHRVTEHGAAVAAVISVREARLDVIASEPPLRHANIRGWPKSADPEEQKSKRKEVAMCIAEAARRVPWV